MWKRTVEGAVVSKPGPVTGTVAVNNLTQIRAGLNRL